jgi:hypothetical protein
MLKQFYEKALPSQGVYCVGAVINKKMKHHFSKTLDGAIQTIENLRDKGYDLFVAMGTFEGHSRKAEDCVYQRSFFIDLDVGELLDKDGNPTGKYEDKDKALEALQKLLDDTGLPDPVVTDSGGGIHAYWPFDKDISRDEWKGYAEKFKALCLSTVSIDPAVSADAARILRCPETFNHKFDPKRETFFMVDEFPVYDWEEMKEFLGEPVAQKVEDVLATVSKGLDDDTKAMLKLDNFAKTFETLADKSLNGTGCNQITHILTKHKTLKNPCGGQVYQSQDSVTMEPPPSTKCQRTTTDTTMKIQKKKQVASLLREPAIGSLVTTQSIARDANTREKSQPPSSSPKSSSQPPRQIKRNQFGRNRVPKQFLISLTTCSPS